MKIRQALKLYGKTKFTLLEGNGFVLGGPGIKYRQERMCTGQRYRQRYNDKRLKTSRYYYHFNNLEARNRVIKYLNNNPEVSFVRKNPHHPKHVNFDVIKKTNTEVFKNFSIPEIGRTYYVYDDGKIRLSRESQVTILEVIPYNEAPVEVINDWIAEYHAFWWNKANVVDYFVKTVGYEDNIIWFTRTVDGEWYSFGMNWFQFGGGYLDIEDKWHNKLIKE